jgi:hypothetical protein
MSSRTIAMVFLWMSVSLAACGGDDGGSPMAPDADLSLPLCTGEVYDACTDTAGASDCGDGLQCHYFETAALTVCVPACDDANPCPDQAGVEVRCNNMGRCRPDMGNECRAP